MLDQKQFLEDSYVDWAKEQSGLRETALLERKEKVTGGSVEEIIKSKLL